ncbi:MAG: flagellin [Candidatus Eremiobacteraeota bacterium]|nr:flagellin [Candidatus Eremiobacteraeota bacterium]
MIVSNIGPTQAGLTTSVRRLSSGLRVSSAADDPSGLAIATDLQTQSQGLDQGRRNVADATNALAVADSALSTVTDILQRMRTLTVQGRSDLLSANDRANVNAELRTLARATDATTQSASFNGVALFGDRTPPGRVVTVEHDDSLASGKPLVDEGSLYVDTANGANLDFTVGITAYDPVSRAVTVRFDASSLDPAQTFDNTFPQSRTLPTAQPSSTWWIDDAGFANRLITLTINQVSAADVGATFQVATAAATSTARDLAVATGDAEGRTASVSVEAISSSILGIAGAAISTDDTANARIETTLDAAIARVGAARAILGAQSVSLGEESANAGTASLNLAASQSAISDLDVGAESTNYAKLQTLATIQTSLQASVRQRDFALTGTLINALR